MIKPPYDSCREWNSLPVKDPAYFSYDAECISHKTGEIKSKTNQVEIVTKLRYDMEVYIILKEIKRGKETGKISDQYTMHYISEDRLGVNIRLPKSGEYVVNLCGIAYGMSKEDATTAHFNRMVTYKIVETGGEKIAPFLVSSGLGLGASRKFKSSGMIAMVPSPLIEAKNGKASIEVICKNGILPMLCGLSHEEDRAKDLSNYTYAEVQSKKRACFHIRCPKPGSYVFTISVKYKDDNSGYLQSAVFIILCNEPGSKESYPNDTKSVLWGPAEFMRELGIQAASTSSTITTENNGEAVLRLKLPKGITISTNVFDLKGDRVDQSWVCAERINQNDGSKLVNVKIRCPKKGKYRLMLFGNHDSIPTNHYAGRWLIECDTPCDGRLFPKCSTLWGTNPHFETLGLEVVSTQSSTIKTQKGRATLSFKCTKKNYQANKFVHSLLLNEKTAADERRCIMAEVDDVGNDTIMITYHFVLLSKGFYNFQLFGNPRTNNSNTFAGRWLIVCDDPGSKEQLFPEHYRPWGPVDEFDRLNLQVQEPKSSTIRTHDGQCTLVIKSTKPIGSVHSLKRSGENKSIHQSAGCNDGRETWAV